MREPLDRMLNEDYLYCEEVIKKHSRSFYYAFSQLPEEKAKAIYAIYAFCRRADDTVDMAPNAEQQRKNLDQLERELVLFEAGKPLDDPVWCALTDVFQHFPMDIEPFYHQIKGQRMDIDFASPNTLEDLEEYSYYVAGTVGLMLLPLLAENPTKEIAESAVSLGIAMQITNILRDIGEDWRENTRVYIPSQILDQENYSMKELKSGAITSNFICIWERLASRSEELYENFKKDIHLYDKESRLPVLVSANVYRGILDAVRKNNYNCFDKRNAVTPLEMDKIRRKTKQFLKSLKT
ncbi:phytoene/squalene synthase family protein [Desemzia sp. RIT804]|uniref:phytoene/squalene synthase family protein n=1 Tax=Desemzia sp. RIT 804 TaxID=2810209 RepID=UPI00194DDE4E|nr:phytoene/squalene synthase family protein [Desemzia sp. RIT 804]MBM6613280.1 phytoene/squalene synthase family protein [Desemzia sp. RIT 804]